MMVILVLAGGVGILLVGVLTVRAFARFQKLSSELVEQANQVKSAQAELLEVAQELAAESSKLPEADADSVEQSAAGLESHVRQSLALYQALSPVYRHVSAVDPGRNSIVERWYLWNQLQSDKRFFGSKVTYGEALGPDLHAVLEHAGKVGVIGVDIVDELKVWADATPATMLRGRPSSVQRDVVIRATSSGSPHYRGTSS